MAAPMPLVDQRLLIVEAALIDWEIEARARKIDVALSGPRVVVALRWHLNAVAGNPQPGGQPDRGIGLPTGPFTVWRRPSFAGPPEKQVSFTPTNMLTIDGRLVLFGEPLAMVRMTVSSPAGGPIRGLANAPESWSTVTASQAAGGQATVELHGAYLNGALIPIGMSVTKVVGVPVQAYRAAADWKPIEVVGLPVDPGKWAGVGSHATPQGLVGSLVDPRLAAAARIARGTPPFGWGPSVQAGVDAPKWKAPDPPSLVDEVNADVVRTLRDVLVAPQMEQSAVRAIVEVPPPATLDGAQTMQAKSSPAEVSPLMLLRAATATDPFLSLALGYGTTVAEEPNPEVKAFHDGSRWDFMVTAPYGNGLDGKSGPVTLVAYALRPPRALPPFVPAGLFVEQRASLAPATTDADWGASSVVQWDRPPKHGLVRVASFAASRHGPGAAAAAPLMEPRQSGGHKPIAPGRAGFDDQSGYVHFTDRYLQIPNDPGTRSVRYSIATQTLFGLWSPWAGIPFTAKQPQTPAPRIVASRIDVVAPANPLSKACTGTLTVDVAYDWTDRSPLQIILEGRMYASPDQATGPPVPFAPGGLERAIDTFGAPVVMDFAGDTATVSGGPVAPTLTYLNAAGDTKLDSPLPEEGVRRYRIAIPGLDVDFTNTPHIGVALWARAVEQLAPKHQTASSGPAIVYTSDPVAPPVPPELVPLGSLPDGEGLSHARISWPPAPGAAGYTVYTSDESTLLSHYGQPEPAVSATLSDRKAALLDEWEASPDRRPFTRLNARPLSASTLSLDVALPKGATGIHAYVVVASSPGQVEGPWPSPASPNLRDEVILRAAPRIATPTAPSLQAMVQQDGTVKLDLATRPGHRVGRVDIHRVRVDDAARSLDTMGPPLVRVALQWAQNNPIPSVAPGAPGWSVQTDDDGVALRFSGSDAPGASWRRVWYRAVAWAAPEWEVLNQGFATKIAEQGLLSGRSEPSNAVSVVLAPAGEPDLSPPVVSWPGGAPANVQLDWSTLAPLAPTALGSHRLDVHVAPVAAQGQPLPTPLVSYGGDLGATPSTPPPGDGLWRVAAGPPGPSTFRALAERASVDDALDVIVRITDPRGRITERMLRVDAGPVLPEPELADVDLVALGADLSLSFTSSAPLDLFQGLPYVLKVTAVAPAGPGKIAAQPVVTPFARPGALTPSAERFTRAAPAGEPDGRGGAVIAPPERQLRPKTHTLEVALRDIPLDTGQPPGVEPLQVRRKGSGRRRVYAVLARVPVASFTVRLTAPDGRSQSLEVRAP